MLLPDTCVRARRFLIADGTHAVFIYYFLVPPVCPALLLSGLPPGAAGGSAAPAPGSVVLFI